MNTSILVRCFLSVSIAAALLAGCGSPPIGAPGAMLQTSAIATHAERDGSWMLPEAKGEDLLYVTTLYSVKVYSYPAGKHVGTLGNVPGSGQECVDAAGDVFIASDRVILEYKHGGKKPIGTFTQSGYNPGDCASDPMTGSLAVTWSNFSSDQFNGYVAVYQHASGNPTTYSLSGMVPTWCGYDDKGNLFCDGEPNHGSAFRFAELPKGGSALESVSLNQSIGFGYSVQWDGKYLTVQDSDVNKIYGFAISGSAGTLKRTVALVQAPSEYDLSPTWIVGKRVVAANIAIINNQPIGKADYYRYPQGGLAIKDISVGDDTAPHGVTVSLAPGR